MNGLYILIPDTSHILAAEHLPRELSTPALSDDTGSCSSRESSPPATPVSGLSRAPSISFDDDPKHMPTGYGTDIGIVEPDVDYSLPEDISRPRKRGRVGDVEPDAVDPSLEYVSRPLKRKRCADTSTYDVRAKRARTSGTSSDATKTRMLFTWSTPVLTYTCHLKPPRARRSENAVRTRRPMRSV
ncbi:hypothetical protein IEO21_10842 [Rhodonia placenta]|uniref:Uncharacterized protein n=1 Tax=Rhodonia placenta TaxID=104341 RepID=A0A8H7NRS9_9APHY|nr:hypothetical protein IEO21_10842 [Postia placenta]